MIKKSIITALVLFVSYSIFVVFFAPTWWQASQHQSQDNVIKAQKFIYNDNDSFNNIIVGSSFSTRLVMDSLPNTYNLSFAGQSIYDGLNILTHRANLPKNIFIEMNVVLREENKEFTSTLNSPPLQYPRKIFLSLRDDKQPLAVIGDQVNTRVVSGFFTKVKTFLNLTQQNIPTHNGDVFFSRMLDIQIENYSKLPDQDLLDRCFNKLRDYIAILEKKGVNIVFFEMPVNSELNNLPRAVTVRSTFYKRFPVSKYTYISLPDFVKYKTTDGGHLTQVEALQYTGYLRLKMKGYLPQTKDFNKH